jgi:hypothetical protein
MEEMREHSKAAGDARKLAVIMAGYANVETDRAYASDRELMRNGFSKSAIYDGLKKLQRLGELVRLPDAKEGPRVFLVCPHGHEQLCLTDHPGPPLGRSLDGPQDVPGTVQPTRAREGNPIEPRTQELPRAGARGATLTAPSPITSPANGHDAERVAPSKSRRRQDRRQRRRPSAPGLCPLSVLDAERLAMLTEETETIIEALRQRYGEDTKHGRSWRLRSRGAHLHALDPLTLAFPPVDWSWVKAEFPIALEKVCGRPVQLVACDCEVS